MRTAQGRYAKGGRLTLWSRQTSPRPTVPLGSSTGPIIPLVGSGVAGPLALMHLPRMWFEGLLHATGRTAPAFTAGRPLFDEVMCETIGLDVAALRGYLTTRPYRTYADCETWVGREARRLDAAAIAQSNNALRKAMLDGSPLIATDDLAVWAAVHAHVVGRPVASLEPIVPAISSRVAGPLGIDHLPRLWLKGILKAHGALPLGYRAGAHRVVQGGLAVVPGGLDAATCARIGLDMAASSAFIESALPDYPAYERWVRANASRLTIEAIARHNAVRGDTRRSKAIAEKAYARWPGAADWNYLIDDLIDWQLIFEVVTGAPLPPWTGPKP